MENTALLRSRFPDLSEERMLIPGLSALTNSRGILFVVTDVEGEGSDADVSYGLAASADYIFELKTAPDVQKEKKGGVWAEVRLINVRGKHYGDNRGLLTVDQGSQELRLSTIEGPPDAPLAQHKKTHGVERVGGSGRPERA